MVELFRTPILCEERRGRAVACERGDLRRTGTHGTRRVRANREAPADTARFANALAANFINLVISRVEALRNRRRPHRKSGYPDLHYVDDQERLFDYGPEEHSQIATGTPHTSMCVLLGSARFGRKIPLNRHYNVTKEKGAGTEIEGSFVDCHDVTYTVSPISHLNVFVNDY